MQQQRMFVTGFLGMTVMILCGSPQAIEAQSAPPGQVSHRMTSAPASAKDIVHTTISPETLTIPLKPEDIKKLSVTAGTAKNPAGSPALAEATATVDSCKDMNPYSVDMDECQAKNALGSAKKAAWEAVVAIDNESPAASPPNPATPKLTAARNLAMLFQDTTDLPAAESLINRQERAVKAVNPPNQDAVAAVSQIKSAIKGIRCSTVVSNPDRDASVKPKFTYGYRVLAPTFGATCSGDAIKSYFSAGDPLVEAANQVKYLYNAQQSASQFSGDLLTATFPGFQAVLSGTATAGASQPAAGTTAASGSSAVRTLRAYVHPFDTATTSSAPTTDSVATAVSKIENGGDFNVRFPVPLMYYTHGNYSISSGTHPNVGFNIDKFSGQSTITESTEYALSVPWETYLQTKSLDVDANGISNAVLFLDLQPSVELISTALANKIGLTGSRAFFLGQAAVGIQFSNSIGISFQYFYGPKQALANTDASGTTTMSNPRIQGFHLAVSFSPQKKSKS